MAIKSSILWKVHVTIGRCRSPYLLKYSFLPFTLAFSLAPFSKSPSRSPDSKVFVFGMRFHHFGVNGMLKQREKYSFLTENVYV